MSIIPLATWITLIAAAAGCSDVDPGAEPRRPWTASYAVARGDDVWLGSTPDAAALAAAGEQGIRVIVDLRGHEEKSGAVRAEASRRGLTLREVPFVRGEPITVDAVRAVTEIVADAETGSVLVFCASGQRAAAWWAARMIEGDGVGLERALERARRAGVSHAPTIAALEAFAREVEARKEVDRLAEGLTGTLMQRLGSAIEEGGIEHAARVCARSASTITAELGARQGVVVRRTSLRWRNPENQPTADERPWLIAAEAALDAGRAIEPLYEVVREKDGSAVLRHLRPIVFPGGLCSQCHGSKGEIPAEVRTFLAERYPDDRAINFTPGELRGAIRVTVPLE